MMDYTNIFDLTTTEKRNWLESQDKGTFSSLVNFWLMQIDLLYSLEKTIPACMIQQAIYMESKKIQQLLDWFADFETELMDERASLQDIIDGSDDPGFIRASEAEIILISRALARIEKIIEKLEDLSDFFQSQLADG